MREQEKQKMRRNERESKREGERQRERENLSTFAAAVYGSHPRQCQGCKLILPDSQCMSECMYVSMYGGVLVCACAGSTLFCQNVVKSGRKQRAPTNLIV